jgi:hypothetical protein
VARRLVAAAQAVRQRMAPRVAPQLINRLHVCLLLQSSLLL